MYQPPPIPYINKRLPQNGTSLSIMLFLGLNAFFLFYRTPFTRPMAYVFADRAGLLFVANLPLLYLLSAKNTPWRSITGRSYEGLNILHRRTGELLCSFAVLHFAGMLVVWYDLLRPLGFTVWQLFSIKYVLFGLFAFVSYEVLYLTSLSSFRQRAYELFLASHIVLQIAGLTFLWLHYWNCRPYVGIALGIFLIDRIVFRAFLKRRSVLADLTILEDGATVLVSAASSPLPPTAPWYTRLWKQDINYGWSPSEHIYISLPAIAPVHFLQAVSYTHLTLPTKRIV